MPRYAICSAGNATKQCQPVIWLHMVGFTRCTRRSLAACGQTPEGINANGMHLPQQVGRQGRSALRDVSCVLELEPLRRTDLPCLPTYLPMAVRLVPSGTVQAPITSGILVPHASQ